MATASAAAGRTRERILTAAVVVLVTRGADAVRIDEILITADASASSLYHHFGDRKGLIRAASAVVNDQLVASEDRSNLDGGYAATTPEEFCDYVVGQLRRAAISDENRSRRTQRVRLAAESIGEPPTDDVRMQTLMMSTIADLFEDAKSRHLINPELDTFAYAMWFQGMLLGQLLTESMQPDVERWLAVAIPAALAPLQTGMAPTMSRDSSR